MANLISGSPLRSLIRLSAPSSKRMSASRSPTGRIVPSAFTCAPASLASRRSNLISSFDDVTRALAVKLSAGTSLILKTCASRAASATETSNCRSEPGNPSVWRVPFALAVISPNFASRASCVSSPASFNWASTSSVPVATTGNRRFSSIPPMSGCSRISVRSAPSRGSSRPRLPSMPSCSLSIAACIDMRMFRPEKSASMGPTCPSIFRPVLVEPAFAGDCQQAVLAGFDGQGLELRDAVRAAGFAIGHLDIAELCVLDDCRDFLGARVARGFLRRIFPPRQRPSCPGPRGSFRGEPRRRSARTNGHPRDPRPATTARPASRSARSPASAASSPIPRCRRGRARPGRRPTVPDASSNAPSIANGRPICLVTNASIGPLCRPRSANATIEHDRKEQGSHDGKHDYDETAP